MEQTRSLESMSGRSASCKERGIKLSRKKKWRFEKENNMKEEHTSDKGGEEEKKRKIKTLFFLNGTFFLSRKCFSKLNSIGYLH